MLFCRLIAFEVSELNFDFDYRWRCGASRHFSGFYLLLVGHLSSFGVTCTTLSAGIATPVSFPHLTSAPKTTCWVAFDKARNKRTSGNRDRHHVDNSVNISISDILS